MQFSAKLFPLFRREEKGRSLKFYSYGMAKNLEIHRENLLPDFIHSNQSVGKLSFSEFDEEFTYLSSLISN